MRKYRGCNFGFVACILDGNEVRALGSPLSGGPGYLKSGGGPDLLNGDYLGFGDYSGCGSSRSGSGFGSYRSGSGSGSFSGEGLNAFQDMGWGKGMGPGAGTQERRGMGIGDKTCAYLWGNST